MIPSTRFLFNPEQVAYGTSAPANEAVEYEERVFDGGFFTKANEYMGFPTKETDKAWDDLFNCKSLRLLLYLLEC